MADEKTALRKRAQIAKANRMMFLWVAAAAAVVGFAAVASLFLWQRLTFNERILSEKSTTVSTLRHNNEAVTELENQVRALDSSERLLDLRANDDDTALQVVLDALPTSANELALGASLQDRLLAGAEGVQVESIQVDVANIPDNTADQDAGAETDSTDESGMPIGFRIIVVGERDDLRSLMVRLQRSIRTIDIHSFGLEVRQGNNLELTLEGSGFYEPARVLELRDRVLQP